MSTIQEANWYKPEAGQPYRPLIAMPSQLKQKIPWLSVCQGLFTAFDPPHALTTVTALVPGPTSASHAKAQPLTPAPSATRDTGARKTTNGAGPVPSLTNAKESSDFKQASGISRNSGQSSSTSEGPGHKMKSSIHSLPQSTTAVSSNQDSSPSTVSTAIAIPATTMKKGNPSTTLRGTLVAPDTSGPLLIRSKTIPIPTGMDSESFTTTTGGRVVTTTSNATTIAGTTLGPGDASASVERHCASTRRGFLW